jgi:hypothetical protein
VWSSPLIERGAPHSSNDASTITLEAESDGLVSEWPS